MKPVQKVTNGPFVVIVFYICMLAILLFGNSARAAAEDASRDDRKQSIGKLPDGTPIESFTMTNGLGLQATVMT